MLQVLWHKGTITNKYTKISIKITNSFSKNEFYNQSQIQSHKRRLKRNKKSITYTPVTLKTSQLQTKN